MASPREALNQLMDTEGALCAALVDHQSGMLFEVAGAGTDMEVAAAGYTELIRAQFKTLTALGHKGKLDDILITLAKQYHLLRPVPNFDGLFLCFMLDRANCNLALARRKLQMAEASIAL